ncbi:aspartate aminotransferase family protein [Lentisphaerota bacterium ZTH]|nr:aspartate aminotransferase family protein [Lentisphaerota bacterium]WET07593.1 aspartate aminotransferase family protein [Lentisphaerota bacterium ZTH]
MSDAKYQSIAEKYQKFVMPTYAPQLLLVRGEGSWVWDSAGNRYLDFGTGISVCNLGHCHPAVTKATQQQAGMLVHVSNLYMNEKQAVLAEKLVRHCFDGVAFFANSGAEANEGLIKFARKWGSDKGKDQIITMKDSFHGRTLATLAATGRSKYRKGFAPDMPGFSQVPFNDFDALAAAVTDQTAAILLEPVQGEGGIIPADTEYLKKVRALCDEKGILLLFDEVQCGMGRTGYFFAFKGYGVEPDAVSIAKALGNGFPIGAFIVRREHAETLTVGTHASTFGGTPLACATACAVIDAIHNENILANCIKMGHFFKTELEKMAEKYACIKSVRCRGLMIGVQLDGNGGDLLPLLLKQGMIALSAGEDVLRLMPPLNLSEEEAEQGLKILEKVFSEISA